MHAQPGYGVGPFEDGAGTLHVLGPYPHLKCQAAAGANVEGATGCEAARVIHPVQAHCLADLASDKCRSPCQHGIAAACHIHPVAFKRQPRGQALGQGRARGVCGLSGSGAGETHRDHERRPDLEPS